MRLWSSFPGGRAEQLRGSEGLGSSRVSTRVRSVRSPLGSPSLTSPYPSPAENTPTPNYQLRTQHSSEPWHPARAWLQIVPRITLGEG